ncbi:hypothetical protein BX666DRAFT_2033170 [Dichotomocladium elegans]|nr:hypothetical protein BX666DRAFT_2033170 [Dichotomocladium elegans]
MSPKVSPPLTSDPATLTPDLRVLAAMSHAGIHASSVRSFSGFTTAQEMLDFAGEVLRSMPSLEGEIWFLGFNILPEEIATPIFREIEKAGHVPFFFPEEEVSWKLPNI